MSDTLRIFHPRVVLHGGGVALVCDRNGEIDGREQHGFFAGDTRVLSDYRVRVNGCEWEMLGHARQGYGSVQWHYQNKPMHDSDGAIEDGCVVMTLSRRVDGSLHDDFDVSAYAQRPLCLRLAITIDADFADLFEVKKSEVPPRPHTRSSPRPGLVVLGYDNAGFRRGLRLRFDGDTAPQLHDCELIFEMTIAHGQRWHCCLDAEPDIGGTLLRMPGDPHAREQPPHGMPGPSLHGDALLEQAFVRSQEDLRSLAMPQRDAPPYLAGGIPWYLTLFGRDPLLAAIMSGIDGTWAIEGALAALADHQATVRDDFRDAEPGKLPHEWRHDELTEQGKLPYSPYYGTHDAQALYCLALWNAWRWTGRKDVLDRYFDTAWRALQWCDKDGDRDGDGLLEYETRSAKGYRNLSWKDSSKAVVYRDGSQAKLPLATVELQAYLYAARLAMAELLEVRGDAPESMRLRQQAARLREQVEQRYWMPSENFYAFALDGDKRQVDAISSNPGHLAWCGLMPKDRSAAVAERLLAPDMFSGWGLRSLSASNPAYNPISYQCGSVWPFDTLIAAAGMWRYGHYEHAFILIKAILDAAAQFESSRLPELFGGFERDYGSPVPYRKANLPQAWSAAASLLAVQLMLGLVPDAAHGRCYFQPRLPRWLNRLRIENVRVGAGSFDLVLRRDGDRTLVEQVEGKGVDMIHQLPEAPLWGKPVTHGAKP